MLNDKKEACRIGVMGGTFDPIHFGHLVLAETVRESLDLAEVIFIPTGDPPHKKDQNVSDGHHRLQMVEKAIASNPHFTLSDIEVKRPGFSYTVDTLETLMKDYGPFCDLYFITGADAIVDIFAWKDVGRIIELSTLVAAARPGTDKKKLSDFLEDLPPYLYKKIELTQVPALQISSTDIRTKRAQDKTITYLLPREVEDYIYEQGLYHKGGQEAQGGQDDQEAQADPSGQEVSHGF